MKHKLNINVAKESPKVGIVACKKKKVKIGSLKKILEADADKVTIIMPVDSVEDVSISAVDDSGGVLNGK